MTDDPYRSLRYPEYRAFLAAMAAVFLATQIQSTVLGWQVYNLTGDPLALGFVGLAEALPFLTLTLVGGWAADREDRRKLAIASLVVVGVSGASLLTLSLGAVLSVWPFYAAQVVAGVGRAFYRPASIALGSELVPREHYHNAATWRATTLQLNTILGPAVGGALIALGGPRLAYGVVVGLTMIGLGALLAVAPRPRPPAPSGHILANLADGIRFVTAEPLLLGAMSLDMFAVLFGGASALLPVFARDVLHVDEVGFGILRAAPAAGSVLMSIALARAGHVRRAGRVLLWSVVFFGISWIAFAISRSYALSLALLAVGGAMDSISVVLRTTLLQIRTPQDKMGRVAAVNSFFIGSSNELGAFESGVAARVLGVVPSVVFGGIMTLVTVAAVAWRAPSLRRLERITP